MEDPADVIAARALDAARDPRLRPLARLALADTLAVAAAAARMEPRARRAAEALASGQGGAVVVGLWARAPPMGAAAATALLSHALELDDWLAPGYVHAGSVVVPVVAAYAGSLTVGEAEAAVAAGYEAALLAGSLLGRRHYREWHSTATAGSVAAAVAAAVAWGHGGGEAARAASIAAAYMGGVWAAARRDPGVKPLSPAQAVLTGLAAASAAEGAAGVAGVLLEACRLHGGECGGGGWPPEGRGLELNGFKFYPACRHAHTAIEAAVALSPRAAREGVERVEVRVHEEAAAVAGRRRPRTVEEARFSLPYLVAAALRYGRLGLGELRRGLGDPEVSAIEGLVEVVVDEEYTRLYPRLQPATVVLRTRRGNAYRARVDAPRGDPLRRPGPREIAGKAAALAGDAGDGRVAALAREVLGASPREGLAEVLERVMEARL